MLPSEVRKYGESLKNNPHFVHTEHGNNTSGELSLLSPFGLACHRQSTSESKLCQDDFKNSIRACTFPQALSNALSEDHTHLKYRDVDMGFRKSLQCNVKFFCDGWP